MFSGKIGIARAVTNIQNETYMEQLKPVTTNANCVASQNLSEHTKLMCCKVVG